MQSIGKREDRLCYFSDIMIINECLLNSLLFLSGAVCYLETLTDSVAISHSHCQSDGTARSAIVEACLYFLFSGTTNTSNHQATVDVQIPTHRTLCYLHFTVSISCYSTGISHLLLCCYILMCCFLNEAVWNHAVHGVIYTRMFGIMQSMV